MVALGVSGIGDVQGAFVQNTKKLTEYYDALDGGPLPHRARLRPRRRRRAAPPRDHRADVQRLPRHRRGRAALRHRLRRVLRAGAGRADGARTRRRPTAWSQRRRRRHRSDAARAGCSSATSAWCSIATCAPAPRAPRRSSAAPYEHAPRVVVVGGGITGLAPAVTLQEEARARRARRWTLTVLEAAPRGRRPRRRPTRVDGFVVEAGPNGFLNREPETLALIELLDLTRA